ncbi:hypothetical protein OAJ07_05785 [Gemmatimonadales bacterium]|nr:hypothetical protein [Gemmatimonadales bacterium]
MSSTPAKHKAVKILIPLAIGCAIAALAGSPRAQTSALLVQSFWGAAAVLVGWNLLLLVAPNLRAAAGRVHTTLRAQHYIQAICQLAVYLYWGSYWPQVYDMSVLIGAQLLFAYGFGMLLSWTRGRAYTIGFGPIPIILSINLFLWFRDDWFYLQFLMVAVGFLGKDFIRWSRDGHQTHIFNPSAFALGLFSLVLIASGNTDLTWGQEIASTLTLAPRIYLFLFLVGLVVMYFFEITLVAGTAATVLFGLSALTFHITGVPYFIDSEIPAAVFLGLHLLITDPSTSPRTPVGKTIFGALYGGGVFALYTLLGLMGAPTFYDKLLCVPLLNLSVRAIDQLVRTRNWTEAWTASTGIAARPVWVSPRPNLIQMGTWVLFFGVMSVTGRTDGQHTGDALPFWEEACAEDLGNACDRLIQLEASYCGDNAAWACNELGLHYRKGRIVAPDSELAGLYLARACELRYQAGCMNLLQPAGEIRTEPRPLDLRLLLREGGLNLMEMEIEGLLERACAHKWSFACLGTVNNT